MHEILRHLAAGAFAAATWPNVGITRPGADLFVTTDIGSPDALDDPADVDAALSCGEILS